MTYMYRCNMNGPSLSKFFLTMVLLYCIVCPFIKSVSQHEPFSSAKTEKKDMLFRREKDADSLPER